jgi:hypothetical protein
MEKFEQLTKVQQGLVNGLISEFTKINPKPTNGVKRFGLETINDCVAEEQRFKQTIAKHNRTMMKVFSDQLKADIKEFKKEFGKVIDIELGHSYSGGSERQHTLEKLIEQCEKQPISDNRSTEIKLFFVSKVKKYQSSDSRYDYFDNKQYQGIFVTFKRERVDVKLESGKGVIAFKIVGLVYKNYDWLNDDRDFCKKFSTLDEMVQNYKPLQQQIVGLVQ